MPNLFVVIVEGNLTSSIEPSSSQDQVAPASRLEVGTELANNFRQTGTIDGRYVFADAAGAHAFATLCLEFTKALADKRVQGIKALSVADPYYHAAQSRGPASST
jgi:hypothetical protein